MHPSWWLIALVGCYRPAALDDCLVVCGASSSSTCPPGQQCDGNGKCKSVDRVEACPLDTPDAFEVQDASIDGMLSANAECWGTAAEFFSVCVDPKPMTNLDVQGGTMTIDTTNCPQYQTQASPPAVCVLAYNFITIASTATLRVKGTRPLALVAISTLTVSGTIDVSSSQGDQGASSNVSDCNIPAPGSPGIGQTGGGGGGAGGALAGDGGMGGGGTGGSAGGGGTGALSADKLLRIRGGCPGAAGGKSVSGLAGSGGPGGGAIYLMSKGAIQVTEEAVIDASGAAGAAPGPRGGGGGGGSGGFIGFHGASYAFGATAQIYAVGGGGASGGADTSPGKPGVEATGPMNTATSSGASGSGTGGFGAFLSGGDGTAATSRAGGGGGGGGGGLVGFEGQIPVQYGMMVPAPRNL